MDVGSAVRREHGRPGRVVNLTRVAMVSGSPHDIGTLSALVDRLVVLSEGQILADGQPDAVLADERVVDTYLGGPPA